MPGWIKEFLTPPIFADEEKTRVGGYLNLLNIVGLVGILIIAVNYAFTVKYFGLRQIETLTSIPLVLFQFVLLRKGHVRLVAFIYVVWMWITGFVSTFDTGGVRSIEFSINLLVILAAGMLISMRVATIFGVLSSIAGLGLVIAQTNGLLPPIPSEVNPINGWITQSVFLLFMVGLLYPTVNSLQQSLRRARKSEARSLGIIEHSPDIILEMDRTGIISLINRYQNIYLGKQVREFIHKDDIPNLNKTIDQVFTTGGSCSLELRSYSPDRSITWNSVRVGSITQDGKVISLVALVTDISERKLAEQVLQRYAARLEMLRKMDLTILTTHSPEETALAAVTLLRHVVSYSYAAVTLFDLKNEQSTLLAVSHNDINQSGSGAHDSFEDYGLPAIECLRQGEPFIIENVLSDTNASALDHAMTREGLHAWVKLPLIGESVLIGALNLGRSEPGIFDVEDIHIAKDVANQLTIALISATLYQSLQSTNADLEHRVAERTAQLEVINKDLEAFSYSVSHDLRAPLRAVNGFSKILMDDFSDHLEVQARGYLTRIQENATKMNALIGGLLAFSRLGRQAIVRRDTDLRQLAQVVYDELIEGQYSARQIEFTLPNLPMANVDPILYRQVFTNLLSNAIKFTGKCQLARIEVGTMQSGAETVIFIRDNGIGFNMHDADKLFGVFQRLHSETEFEGTGIGLSNVARIIQKHGGRIWAEAEPDKGAIFYFTLE